MNANLLACKADASKAAGEVFNVATGRRVTLNETFKALQPLTSYSGQVKYGPARGGDVKHSLADVSKAEAGLGYRPSIDFEEGLRRTVEWYRKEIVADPVLT